jgi:hypothetical protein
MSQATTPSPDLLKYVLSFPFACDTLAQTMVSQGLLDDFHARKQLHHENILPLLGFTHKFGPLPAMVSPWLHNGSLTTYLEHHFTELTIEQKLRIVSCFSEALQHHGIHWNLSCGKSLQPLPTVCGIFNRF